MLDDTDADLFPVSSFQTPISPPASGPDAGVFVHVCFSEAWLPLVLGCLTQLKQDTTWDTNDEDVLTTIAGYVDKLLFMMAGECFEVPPGSIMFYGGDTAPTGWLVCDGTAVSRTTYAALFAVIGEVFGSGDGSTTFNLPNLASRLPVGTGQGSGLSQRNLADIGGEEAHTLTVTEMPAHAHSDNGHFHSTHTHLPGVALTPGELPVALPEEPSEATSSGNAAISNTGGDGAHNTMPPWLALTPLIKY
jgi:microcystin-dependent protein